MSKYAVTAGVQDSPVKTVLYGPEGIGKSTFASHFPNPVFIDTEGGTKRLNVARLPQPTSWAMLLDEVAEVRKALEDGCNEIDMVVNISDVKNGLLDKVEEEIRTLKKECGHHILKVIIETCYLTEEEKIAMCKAVTNAGADFIKTSTGFGTGGATKEDVELFKKYIGPNVKIKAAGGVSSMEDLEMFLGLGCERIGTSRAVGLCKGELTEGY